MDKSKYSPGAALCPECGSVVEYIQESCPWCNHNFSGKEAIKILSMLSESGVGIDDLTGELKELNPKFGTSMLEFAKENFEIGGQGAKMASLLVFRHFGDLSEIPVKVLKEGYKISSNAVKIEIIKTLTMAGTEDSATALKELREFENDPEVLSAFSTSVSPPPKKLFADEEVSMEILSDKDIEVAKTKPPAPPATPHEGTPASQSIKAPPPPPHPAIAIEHLKAEEIIPPLPEISTSLSEQKEKENQAELTKTSRGIPGIAIAGIGFVVTGALVLVVLLLLGIKIPQPQISKTGQNERKKQVKSVTGTELLTQQKEASNTNKKEEETIKEENPPKEQINKESAESGTATSSSPESIPSSPQKLTFSISASSQHKDYPPSNMIDGDPKTVWQEEKGAKPLNHKITLAFDKEVTVTGISFITGYDDPHGARGDMFPLNNRLKKANLTFSDGSTKEVEFEDKREPQKITIEPPVKTKEIVITILEVYRGSWFYDNAIAEIQVEGIPAQP